MKQFNYIKVISTQAVDMGAVRARTGKTGGYSLIKLKWVIGFRPGPV